MRDTRINPKKVAEMAKQIREGGTSQPIIVKKKMRKLKKCRMGHCKPTNRSRHAD